MAYRRRRTEREEEGEGEKEGEKEEDPNAPDLPIRITTAVFVGIKENGRDVR